VKERPEGAVDEARRLIELEIAHVALAQIERDPGFGGRRVGCASIAGEESIPITIDV
jgi:hypothetical protein